MPTEATPVEVVNRLQELALQDKANREKNKRVQQLLKKETQALNKLIESSGDNAIQALHDRYMKMFREKLAWEDEKAVNAKKYDELELQTQVLKNENGVLDKRAETSQKLFDAVKDKYALAVKEKELAQSHLKETLEKYEKAYSSIAEQAEGKDETYQEAMKKVTELHENLVKKEEYLNAQAKTMELEQRLAEAKINEAQSIANQANEKAAKMEEIMKRLVEESNDLKDKYLKQTEALEAYEQLTNDMKNAINQSRESMDEFAKEMRGLRKTNEELSKKCDSQKVNVYKYAMENKDLQERCHKLEELYRSALKK
eukprot:Clim_evm107s210 gene=Clim_evmTU107s210